MFLGEGPLFQKQPCHPPAINTEEEISHRVGRYPLVHSLQEVERIWQKTISTGNLYYYLFSFVWCQKSFLRSHIFSALQILASLWISRPGRWGWGNSVPVFKASLSMQSWRGKINNWKEEGLEHPNPTYVWPFHSPYPPGWKDIFSCHVWSLVALIFDWTLGLHNKCNGLWQAQFLSHPPVDKD